MQFIDSTGGANGGGTGGSTGGGKGSGQEPVARSPAISPLAARRRLRLRLFGRAALGVVGALGLGFLIRSVGAHDLLHILGVTARWLPLLLGLEALRIVCEATATFSLSHPLWQRIPLRALARI